jgi:hypothetical protein
MLLFDKCNKRPIKLETAVTWSKSNLNMMNIYEESTINFWIKSCQCGNIDDLADSTKPYKMYYYTSVIIFYFKINSIVLLFFQSYVEKLTSTIWPTLASVKRTWFKTFMSESIARFKRWDNQSRNLNWKIISVKQWKCSRNSWLFICWLCFGKCIKWYIKFWNRLNFSSK